MSLLTPLITNGGYMTLDALLAALIFEQTGDLEKAHSEIPLMNTQGLWHGSAAIFEKIDFSKKVFVANLRASHDLDLDLIAKKASGVQHRRIGLTRRSDYGAVLNTYSIVTVPSITWYAVGDREKINRLLSNVEFIGKRRMSGYGQVAKFQIEDDDLDGLVGHFGEPLRPIPVQLFTGNKASVKADASWKPAYWHPENRAVCFVPENV